MIKKLWKKWLEMGEWIGERVSIIVLTILYIIMMLPLSIFYKFGNEVKGWVKAGGKIDESAQF